MIPKEILELLKKQHYCIVGNHSGVQICRWTKKSLMNEGFCYKEKFYGIKSHLCCQMSPAVAFCYNHCLHCWRAIEKTAGNIINKEEADKPEEIIERCIEAQRKLLSGFGGNKKVNIEKLNEAQNPKQFAISLSGEPFIYPYLPELIFNLNKRKCTSFIVSSGVLPEKILELKEKNALPTQLYISVNAPNEKLFNKIVRSDLKDAWERYNKSLSILSKLNCRTALRITLIRKINMCDFRGYSELIKKANPWFVEIKGFISVGFARKRLCYDKMPTHEEIKKFSKKLLRYLPDYEIADEKKESKVVLLSRKNINKTIK